jgi:hypothetical protein
VLPSPPINPVLESPVNNPKPPAVASCDCGNEAQGAAAVPRGEGNEATRSYTPEEESFRQQVRSWLVTNFVRSGLRGADNHTNADKTTLERMKH